LPELESVEPEIRKQVERDALYANYITRQQKQVDALKRDEDIRIPADFPYESVSGLSNELQSKLSHARPATLHQASRIDGMTPAALALLFAVLRRESKRSSA
jgi:tRNA uridine 5-carboxymethylaminomethyl modification enzyme